MWAGIMVCGSSHALDLNTATQAQLESLKGIGPATAGQIVQARADRRFEDWDDLRIRVKGLNTKTIERLRQQGATLGPDASLAPSEPASSR